MNKKSDFSTYQGNLVGRKPENGPGGIGFREDGTSYALTATDREAVCYRDTVGTLCARDYKGIDALNADNGKSVVEHTTFGSSGFGKWGVKPAMLWAAGGDCSGGSENMVVEAPYAVRKLTPLECLRLQGLPDSHLSDFHIAEPTDADLAYWWNAWETNRIALGKTTKPRSMNQVAKWLKNPYSDCQAYKAIGNALAVPCAIFVMRGIVENACGYDTK